MLFSGSTRTIQGFSHALGKLAVLTSRREFLRNAATQAPGWLHLLSAHSQFQTFRIPKLEVSMQHKVTLLHNALRSF